MLYSDSAIYLDCICLLLHLNDDKTKSMVDEIISILNEYESNTTKNKEHIDELYKSITIDLKEGDYDIHMKKDLKVLLLKYKDNPVVLKEPETYKVLEDIFYDKDPLTPESILKISKRLHNIILWHMSNSTTRKMFGYINKCTSITDSDDQYDLLYSIREAAQKLVDDFDIDFLNRGDHVEGKTVENINFTKKEDILGALKTYTERKKEGAMRMGLQGLNKAFGRYNGPTLGETVVFGALSHHFKSGMLKSVAKWIVKYNEPPEDERGRPALIIFVTLENEGFQNLMWWFENIYTAETGKSHVGVPEEEIVEFMFDFFSKNGYHFMVQRYHPADFGYEELQDIYHKYDRDYNIVSVIIDYMGEMSKGSRLNSNSGNMYLYDELYRNVCNFAKQCGFLLATAHQLNRDARRLAANNSNVVRKYNGTHMADTTGVERIVDTIIFLHLEHNSGGEKYLTGYKYKGREDESMPEKDRYFAYKFEPLGIPDDVLGESLNVEDIYSAGMTKRASSITVEEAF